MADRFPLIVDSTTQTIKELPSGDNLDLTGSSIVNASSIDVTGTVTADGLTVDGTGSVTQSSNTATALMTFTNANAGALARSAISFVSDTGSSVVGTVSSGWTVDALSANETFLYGSNGVSLFAPASQDVRILAGGSEKLVVQSNGNVGIGVSSLVTGSTRRILQVSTGTDGGQIAFADSTTEAANPRIFATNKSDLKLASANSGSSTIQFITGTTTPEERMRIDSSGNVDIKANITAAGPTLTLENTATAVNGQQWGAIHFKSNDSSTGASGTRASIVGTSTSFNGDGNIIFSTAPASGSNTERLRIASDGKLSLNSNGSIASLDGVSGMQIGNSTASSAGLALETLNNGYLMYVSGTSLKFWDSTDNTDRITLDGNGNVGIGCTPEDWDPAFDVLRIGRTANLFSYDTAGDGLWLGSNAFYDDTLNDYKYITTDPATLYNQINGTHVWSYAASGTADTQVTFSEAMRIDSSGNVGIGGITPTGLLTLGTGTFSAAAANTSALYTSTTAGLVAVADGFLLVDRAGADVFKVDTSGNLLVGSTTLDQANNSNTANCGINLLGSGIISGSTNNATTAYFNRLVGDGEIVSFRKDGAPVGSIGTSSADLTIGTGDTGLYFWDGDNGVIPWNVSTNSARDNLISLGTASNRFDDAFITNGVTTGSDRNQKQDIEALSDAEQRVAVACKGLLRKWRWKDAVEAKGDDARIHFGIIAQDLQAAFEAEGLDAGRYAMFMSNTWTDEETGEERTRLGVRYHELLAFIIAAI